MYRSQRLKDAKIRRTHISKIVANLERAISHFSKWAVGRNYNPVRKSIVSHVRSDPGNFPVGAPSIPVKCPFPGYYDRIRTKRPLDVVDKFNALRRWQQTRPQVQCLLIARGDVYFHRLTLVVPASTAGYEPCRSYPSHPPIARRRQFRRRHRRGFRSCFQQE